MDRKLFILLPKALKARVGETIQMDPGRATGYLPANDPQRPTREKLLDVSREVLTLTYQLDDANPVVITHVLSATLSGRSLYGIMLEFFALYGRLEQKLELPDNYRQAQIKKGMIQMAQLNDDGSESFRTYRRLGRGDEVVPLPLYARNVIVHGGTNRLNSLPSGDMDAATGLLKKWLRF